MDFLNRLREKAAVQKIEKFIPAVAFFGGFSWDSITLGHKVYGTDLAILSVYYVLAIISICFISTKIPLDANDSSERAPSKFASIKDFFVRPEWPSIWINRLTWLVQFCFGNLSSALVICYFKSSGSIASFVMVLLLLAILVVNEFLKDKYENVGVCLAFFCLLGTMLFNFLIPHLVHGMGTFWFFFSTLLSVGMCFLLWMLSSRDKRFLIAPISISVVLSVAYLANWIAPVPLVLKQQIVCKNFDNVSYSCDADKLDFWQRGGFKMATIHKDEGEEVYFMSSVYAPAELKAPIEFRWFYKDPVSKKFTLTDKITSQRMIVQGGRDHGYRSYSKKKNIAPGIYRVETAYKDGAVIGSETFKVLDGIPKGGFVRDSLR